MVWDISDVWKRRMGILAKKNKSFVKSTVTEEDEKL